MDIFYSDFAEPILAWVAILAAPFVIVISICLLMIIVWAVIEMYYIALGFIDCIKHSLKEED